LAGKDRSLDQLNQDRSLAAEALWKLVVDDRIQLLEEVIKEFSAYFSDYRVDETQDLSGEEVIDLLSQRLEQERGKNT
jgi:hypothetical protein